MTYFTDEDPILTRIFADYIKGSQGFVNAVSTLWGGAASRSEIERIAGSAKDGTDFERIWSNENWWTDERAYEQRNDK